MPRKENVNDTDSKHNCKWLSFKLVKEDNVRKIILSTKSKSCSEDPILNSILMKCMDSLLPFITTIVNLALLKGIMPPDLKTVLPVPLLKKLN